MENSNSKKRNWTSFIGLGLVVLVVIYAVVQGIGILSKDVEIARLRWYTQEERIETNAVFFRDETVVSSSPGSFDFAVNDGDRVAIGDRIVTVYSATRDAGVSDRIAKLQAQLDSLKELYDSGNLFDYDISRLDSQINATITDILEFAQVGNASDAQPLVRALAKYMNQRSIIDGKAQVSVDEIKEIEQEIKALSSGANVTGVVYSPGPGYFTTAFDGMEGELPYDMAETLSVPDLQSLLNKQPSFDIPETYVGTVIKGFSWKCAFLLPESFGAARGNYIRLRFPDYSEDSYRVPIVYVSDPVDGQVVVAVEDTDEIDLHLAEHIRSVEVISSRSSGYYVTKNAIKYKDDQTGVYLLKGKILSFAPVNIVYSGDGFVLLTAVNGSISESDDVVISGRDLYTGRVVKGG